MFRTPRTLVVLASAFALAVSSLVAAPGTTVAAGSVPRFLTLPFKVTKRMRIQQGNLWQGPGHGRFHGGIDYINGTRDRSRTWRTFPVYAAAAGYACANLTGRKGCIVGVGNRVLITHTIRGRKYRTYYGHLEAISTRIPIGGKKTVFVKRGELLGYAGYSGDPCCVRHLHFQLFDPHWNTVDPYGIDGTRGDYPDPRGTNGIRDGRRSYWLTDPPTEPADFIDRPVQRIPYGTRGSRQRPKADPKPTRERRAEPRRTQRPERTARPARTPRPTASPRITTPPEPTTTPGIALSPAPIPGATLPPGPSLVAAATRSIEWWARVVTQVLQALRGL